MLLGTKVTAAASSKTFRDQQGCDKHKRQKEGTMDAGHFHMSFVVENRPNLQNE